MVHPTKNQSVTRRPSYDIVTPTFIQVTSPKPPWTRRKTPLHTTLQASSPPCASTISFSHHASFASRFLPRILASIRRQCCQYDWRPNCAGGGSEYHKHQWSLLDQGSNFRKSVWGMAEYDGYLWYMQLRKVEDHQGKQQESGKCYSLTRWQFCWTYYER